ncbi:hypothetical protein Tco_0943532 [Tanacetum coccineum]
MPKPRDTAFSNIKTYFPDFPQPQLRKPWPRDYSFKEWLKIKLGHTNVSKSIRNKVLNEWVIDSSDVEVDFGKTRDDPYSRRFDEYKEEFANEIEQLANEYDLRVGRKREEEERWESGIKKIDYEPPFVKSETFEVKRYSFRNGKSFVCVTKQLDDALPLGRVNGSRFMGMIRKEMDEEGRTIRKMFSQQGIGIRGLLDSLSCDELCGYVLWKPSRDFTRPLGPPTGLKGLLHMLNATVIPTKLCKNSSLAIIIRSGEQRSEESLVLNSTLIL